VSGGGSRSGPEVGACRREGNEKLRPAGYPATGVARQLIDNADATIAEDVIGVL